MWVGSSEASRTDGEEAEAETGSARNTRHRVRPAKLLEITLDANQDKRRHACTEAAHCTTRVSASTRLTTLHLDIAACAIPEHLF